MQTRQSNRNANSPTPYNLLNQKGCHNNNTNLQLLNSLSSIKQSTHMLSSIMSLSVCKFVAGLIVQLVAWCKCNNIRFTVSAATLSHINPDIIHPTITTSHQLIKCFLYCFHISSVKMKQRNRNGAIQIFIIIIIKKHWLHYPQQHRH